MSKYIFPAILQWDKKDNVYYVNFPDVDGCFTDGATLTEAMENAGDVLNLMLWTIEQQKQAIPEPPPRDNVKIPENGFVNLVVADTAAYQEVIARENSPEPTRERSDSDLAPFLDMIIRAANDPEVQKDFQAWKEAKKGRKSHPERHTARHLYLESDLDKGLGE